MTLSRPSEPRVFSKVSRHLLDVGDGYRVERVSVAPRVRLRMHTHEHSFELAIVVAGTATCVVDDRLLAAHVGDRVVMPRGSRHRIANEAAEQLILIEVLLGVEPHITPGPPPTPFR